MASIPRPAGKWLLAAFILAASWGLTLALPDYRSPILVGGLLLAVTRVMPERLAGRFWLALFVSVTVGLLDIGGLHSGLEPPADILAQRIRAPILGVTGDKAQEGPQKEILVVLIDPEYMNSGLVRAWPLAVDSLLGTIIKPILNAGPKAVFLDVSLTDTPRPMKEGGQLDPQAMTNLGTSLRAATGHIPFYLATGLPIGDCGGRPWVDVEQLTTGGTTSAALSNAATGPGSNVEMIAARWADVGSDYPFAATLVAPNGSCHAAELVPHGSDGSSGWLLSPAAEIYVRLWCQPKTRCNFVSQSAAPEHNHGFRLRQVNEELLQPMALEWRSRVSEQYFRVAVEKGSADRCVWQTRQRAPLDVLVQAVRSFLPSPAKQLPIGIYERPCPYFDTISAQQAADSAVSPDTDFQKLVKGRVVMIGTAISQTRDVVLTPFDAEVPGVYLHAMALDALINAKQSPERLDYPRRPEGMGKVLEIIVEGIVIVLLGLFVSPRLGSAGRRLMEHVTRPNSVFWRLAFFPVVLLPSAFLFYVAGLVISVLAGYLFLAPYFGSPFFVALVATMVMIEDLHHHYFNSGQDHQGEGAHASHRE